MIKPSLVSLIALSIGALVSCGTSNANQCTLSTDCPKGNSCESGRCVSLDDGSTTGAPSSVASVGSAGAGGFTSSTTSGTSSASASTTSTGAGGAGSIPDPGSGDAFDSNLGSIEPNDTPEQATPLGTAIGPNLYVWVSDNPIGGADGTDYFVFRSGPMPGEFQLGLSGLCWGPPLTNLTATLWKVVNNQQVMPPIHAWTMSVNNCLMSMPGDALVEASTTYLLGVFATGAAGQYFA